MKNTSTKNVDDVHDVDGDQRSVMEQEDESESDETEIDNDRTIQLKSLLLFLRSPFSFSHLVRHYLKNKEELP